MTNPSPLESIYFAALAKRSSAERMAFLNEACAGNDELRGSVERMLAAQAEVGSFLERPVINGDATVHHEPSITERPGTVIGPYKLLQQIGEGGMGVVFMAEQTDPIQRTVAVKIIKPGMDTRQVIARFEAERQALAMMDHPNIAKVLDAGTTDSGRPYFVMELVKGVPITRYCDEKHLPLRARLELLLPVCQAVQHAHQKGVIHRDIKPTNVLVAEYDNHAVPKVIDFGVAKATAQKLTDRTMFTEFGQVLGTVEYMSPEQAKLNQLDIDTRSDIYSLGVLLYELLTGSTPFGRKRLTDAAFDEALRIIREEEPQKPSTRLSTTDQLPSIAANRHSEPARLSKDVRGELDWVVMKALEKDRNRRYETANDLAADVQRYLHDEPVQACSPSATYRFRKFALRNKAALVTAAIVAVSLVMGTAVSTWQAVRATNAEALAQTRLENESQSRDEADEARRDAERQSDLATRERNRAMDAERGTRRHLQSAQLNLAAASAFRGQMPETLAILEGQRSVGGDAASKGFGWRYLWRLCHQGHLLTLRGHRSSVSSVKFSQDGTLLASGSADGTVRLYDVRSGRLRILTNGTVAIRSIAISPDGAVIAAGCEDGTVSLWDAATGTRRMSSHRHEQPVWCVAFSPNGKLIASIDYVMQASHKSIGEIVICETVSGREVARYAQPGISVAFSPDGNTLAVAQWFDGLRIVDVSNGHVRQTLSMRLGVGDGTFSPDGKSVAGVGSQGEVNVWNVLTGLMLSSLRGGSTATARCVAFSADGTRLACGRGDGMVDLWDLASGRVRSQAHGKRIRSVAFSPDSAFLASGSDDGTVMLWDAEFRPDASPVDGHTGMVWSVNFSPDGKTLASTGDDHTIKLWDVATAQVRTTLKGHTMNVIDAAFSPDGRMLASGGDDRDVRLWDVASGQQLAVMKGHTLQVFAVAFSPDGQTLASGSCDTTVKIWDVAAKAELATLTGHSSGVWSVDFSPDGKLLASGASGGASAAESDGVRLWNLASNSLVRTIPGTNFVKFSPDGKTLETRGYKEKSVVLWDLANETVRATLAKGIVDNFVLNAACSPDGSGLVVSREDGSIREIDAATAEERVLLPSHDGPMVGIAYSPDGNTVASGSRSGQVRFWRAASEHEVMEQGAGIETENDSLRTLATLAQLGRRAEALKLHEETLAVGAAKIEADHPEARESVESLATLYKEMGKSDEAKALLQQASNENARDPQVFKRFADHFARQGEWKLAAPSFTHAYELNPDDDEIILSAAVTALEAGDEDGYRRLCRQTLEHFAETDDPLAADRTAKIGLLTAVPGGDLKQLVKLADVAVENGKKHEWFVYFQMDRGIAAYRTGDWAGTLEWCGRSRERGGSSSSAEALILLFEAMAHHQQKHADQARVAMDQAIAIIDEYLAGAQEDRGSQWKYWLIDQITRREAEELLQEDSAFANQEREKTEKTD